MKLFSNLPSIKSQEAVVQCVCVSVCWCMCACLCEGGWALINNFIPFGLILHNDISKLPTAWNNLATRFNINKVKRNRSQQSWWPRQDLRIWKMKTALHYNKRVTCCCSSKAAAAALGYQTGLESHLTQRWTPGSPPVPILMQMPENFLVSDIKGLTKHSNRCLCLQNYKQHQLARSRELSNLKL